MKIKNKKQKLDLEIMSVEAQIKHLERCIQHNVGRQVISGDPELKEELKELSYKIHDFDKELERLLAQRKIEEESIRIQKTSRRILIVVASVLLLGLVGYTYLHWKKIKNPSSTQRIVESTEPAKEIPLPETTAR